MLYNKLPRRKQRGIGCHSVLDTESSFLSWIPAFAGMTLARQASGNGPEEIQAALKVLTQVVWVLRTGVRG